MDSEGNEILPPARAMLKPLERFLVRSKTARGQRGLPVLEESVNSDVRVENPFIPLPGTGQRSERSSFSGPVREETRVVTVCMSEVKLSRLQRWILVAAYQEILKAGTDQPTKKKIGPWTLSRSTNVHLLRVDVFRDYFKLPVRGRSRWDSASALVLDGSADLKKANAARSSLSRAMRRLRERALVTDNDITLTERGIAVAKELVKPTGQ